MPESLCNGCGKCCWPWPSGDTTGRCEHLADDLKTCLIHDQWEAHGLAQCRAPLPLSAVNALPDECGYVQDWLEKGLVEKDPGFPGRWRVKE